MSIKFRDVDSTNIAKIGYCEKTNSIGVKFNASDDIYLYFGVPSSVYENLVDADSIGSYFSQNIKNNYLNTKIVISNLK